MLNIKQMVYEIVTEQGLDVTDNPQTVKEVYPYGILRTITNTVNRQKNFSKRYWTLRLDVFSTYAGEKEILDTHNALESSINDLMLHPDIFKVDIGLTIMDDTEKGPVTKHGIITVEVVVMEV